MNNIRLFLLSFSDSRIIFFKPQRYQVLSCIILLILIFLGLFLVGTKVFAAENIPAQVSFPSEDLKEKFENLAKQIVGHHGYDAKEIHIIESLQIVKYYSVIYGRISSDTFNIILFWAPEENVSVIYDTEEELARYEKFTKMKLSEKTKFLRKEFRNKASFEFPDEKLIQLYGDRILDIRELEKQCSRLEELKNYEEALPVANEIYKISKELYGDEHRNMVRILDTLVLIYLKLGEYSNASFFSKKSLSIKEKVFGPDHPYTAVNLNGLALLYKILGDYEKAEVLYKRALKIREKTLGLDDPDTALSLNNLAQLYDSIGEYTKAEVLYKRALKIREKTLGPDHPSTSSTLNNLAALYDSIGEYTKAELMYTRALKILEKTFGSDHPDTATSLGNLALLYRNIGDYSKAEFLYERALKILEKTLGPDHPFTAIGLNNLAQLYDSIGEYTKAESLYERALKIYEKALGPDHPNTATTLNNLAGLYRTIGDYAKAESLFKRALKIQEKALGPDHPSTAIELNNLAVLYRSIGDYAKAESLYERALSVNENKLGPYHRNTVVILNGLAKLLAALNDFKEAHSLFMQAQAASGKIIDQVMGFTSENQKIKFLATQKDNLEACFSLVAFHLKNNPDAQKDLLDIWLKRKGIILESQKQFQEALVHSDNSEPVLRVFQELSRVRVKLSKLYFSRLETSDLKLLKNRIAEMENQKEILEAELAKLSQSYSIQRNRKGANSSQVATALPKETVLLEIAKIHQYNFKAIKNEKEWFQANYLVFVLHAGQADRIALIDLGAADIIDSTIQELKYQIKEGQELKASKKLYEMVFAKIKPELDQSKEVFISPDGNLSLIPFEILQDPNGRFLIEDYTFNYLSAGRDILGLEKQKGNSQKSLLIGDPDFDLRVQAINLQDQDLENTVPQLTSLKRSVEMKELHFRRLPGTLKEVQSVRQILGQNGTEIKTGAEAVEQILFQMKSPKILHIATHGFFLNDKNLPELSDDRGTIIPKSLEGMINIENPLVRSGLALAGANNTLNQKDVDESQGLLTAEKVLGLNLTNTELVVLSACDTGLGEVQTGEGVYGLRRAFIQAGAKSLVMSMWKVPDTETMELMVQFYKNIKSGMNRCQALRQAALNERKIIIKRYKKDMPSYWGAFLFLGES